RRRADLRMGRSERRTARPGGDAARDRAAPCRGPRLDAPRAGRRAPGRAFRVPEQSRRLIHLRERVGEDDCTRSGSALSFALFGNLFHLAENTVKTDRVTPRISAWPSTGSADGAPCLMGARCRECATLWFPSGPVCPACRSQAIEKA